MVLYFPSSTSLCLALLCGAVMKEMTVFFHLCAFILSSESCSEEFLQNKTLYIPSFVKVTPCMHSKRNIIITSKITQIWFSISFLCHCVKTQLSVRVIAHSLKITVISIIVKKVPNTEKKKRAVKLLPVCDIT